MASVLAKQVVQLQNLTTCFRIQPWSPGSLIGYSAFLVVIFIQGTLPFIW